MIRPMKQGEARLLGSIWIDASVLAHDFIAPDYWSGHLDDMVRHYIPDAATYVYDENGAAGFISIMNADTIAALFVHPQRQGNGIGGRLLDFAKETYDTLSLTVYEKNRAARTFYEARGFQAGLERIDEATGEREVVMTWANKRHEK